MDLETTEPPPGAKPIRRRRWVAPAVVGVVSLVLAGSVVAVTTPAQALTNNWAQIDAGLERTCGVKLSGTLWCLDRGQVTTVRDWASVSIGLGYHSCALRTSGALYCWGLNNDGELGIGNTTSKDDPTRVGSATWSSVSVGGSHTCGIRNQILYCWGNNNYGQLGLNNQSSYSRPAQVGDGRWLSVATNAYHTCAIDLNNYAYCWGFNITGQVGTGFNTPDLILSPQQLPGTYRWASLSLGTYHTCGVTTSARLYCWGYNSDGQLGIGGRTTTWQPARVGSSTWSGVSAGNVHTCGTHSGGTRFCWGDNSDGRLGIGDYTDRTAPIQWRNEGAWKSVDAGYFHGCGIRGDGTLACWGDGHGALPVTRG